MEKGKILVIEGACDGMGKSTQTSLLLEHLKAYKQRVLTHHFPSYGKTHGKIVEAYLKGEYGDSSTLNPYTVHSIYAIDRALEWHQSLRQPYEEGSTILLDRYTTSSLIYQSVNFETLAEKKDFINFAIEFEYEKLKIGKPDQVLFLYADFDLITEIRSKRVTNDGVVNDIHERNFTFMRKVYENSMFVADYLGWDMVKCDNDTSLKNVYEIHEDIKKMIKI